MRIFIDGYIFWIQRQGGISRHWSELLAKMAELNSNSEFYLYLRPYSVNTLSQYSNVRLLEAKTSLPVRVYNQMENSLIAWYIWRNRPDVFHSTYYTRTNALGIPNVVTVYDTIYELFPQYFPPKIDQFLAKKREVILNADKIIAVSQNTKEDVMSIYHLPEEKVEVIYEGIDMTKFKPAENDRLKRDFIQRYALSKPYFLYVGRRMGYKNFSTLLKAFGNSRLKEDYMLLVIGGESRLCPEEHEIIERGELSECVKFLGQLSTDELILAYSSAHAFVMSSLYEGFGLPVLEAMACGTPVIASNSSSVPEVAGNAAVLFNPRDRDSTVDALERVAQENVRVDLIERGFERVRLFSWDEAARRTLGVYEEVVGEKSCAVVERRRVL